MKLTITIAAMLLTTTAATANGIPQQLEKLRDRIETVNVEDQRLTDGHYNPDTGRLTLYTEDMDGDSRRPVHIDGIKAADGKDGQDGINGKDGRDGVDGTNGRDGQDFDAAGHAASLAAVTALGGLQFQSLSEGQTGWAAGIGGQAQGDAAIAVGINHALADDVSLNASFASTFDGNGVSMFVGVSGKF